MANNIIGGITQLTRSDKTAFNLNSIDLSEYSTSVLGPTFVKFTGHMFAGGTVTQTINLDEVFGNETLIFTGFEDLRSVTWTQEPQFHQFDNIRLDGSAVPLPAAIWLFGSRLIGLLGFSRKNKTQVAA